MKALLVAGEKSYLNEISYLLKDDQFRKSTKNMLLCYHSINKIIAKIPFRIYETFDCNEIGLFIGTSHGELETTKDFLKSIGIDKRARPFLFQHGLHNATLGFICQTLNHTGPAITVSNRFFSGEDAIDLAMDWLQLNKIKIAITVGYDSLPLGLENQVRGLYPQSTQLSTGSAAALVLANEEGVRKILNTNYSINLNNLFLERITYCRTSNARTGGSTSTHYYDSNAIEEIYNNLSRYPNHCSTMNLQKPNGTYSVINMAS
ncbi:MAG: hypothetical protein HQK52_21545 [Oligoflexia bacterium]|nr:hypothetical protein [Oligoflexia bacterium]